MLSRHAFFMECQSGRVIFFENEILSKNESLCRQLFTGVRRIILTETVGTKLFTGNRTEHGSELFRETVADGYCFLHSLSLFMKVYSHEHKGTLHKAALATETSGSIKADSGKIRLRVKLGIEKLGKAMQSGAGAVDIPVMIAVADYFLNMRLIIHGVEL